MTPARHILFSPGRVLTLAWQTVRQLSRMKALYFLVVFSLVVAALSFFTSRLTPEEELRLLKNACFATIRWFGIMVAIAGTAILIPKDMEDRTLYTILSKPLPRIEYLLGKYLGVLFLVAVGYVLMAGLFSGVLYFSQEGVLQRELERVTAMGGDPASLSEVQERIGRLGLTWNLHSITLASFLEVAVLTAASLMLSTMATSTLFTILMGTGVFLIGQMIQTAKDMLAYEETSMWLRTLTMGAIYLFPNLGVFDLANFAVISDGALVPGDVLWAMIRQALSYAGAYLAVAWIVFSGREF
jgi:hypothetical protein